MLKKLWLICFVGTLSFSIVVDKSGAYDGGISSILQEIQKGGYILYMRHGEATVGQDQLKPNFSDCKTQRNLNENGREEAKAIGYVWKEKMIPVHYPVSSSPYCRALQTAEIVFGKQNITINPLIASVEKLKQESVPIDDKKKIVSELSKLLDSPPKQGENTVIVGHTFPANVMLGDIPNLGIVVIKPKGKGLGYTIIGKITPEQLINAANIATGNSSS